MTIHKQKTDVPRLFVKNEGTNVTSATLKECSTLNTSQAHF